MVKRFTVNLPTEGREGEDLLIALSHLIGARELQRSLDGREYIALPAPYADVRIYDGATLTVDECARLAEAIGYFRYATGGEVDRRALDALKSVSN